MPIYTFRNKTTGEEWDDLMSISEMKKFTKKRNIELVPTAAMLVGSVGQMDGADNTKDIDKYEISANVGLVSVGYSKDNNTEIDYMAVSGSHDLGDVALSAAYSIKDSSGTETKGYEVVGTVGNISVGYGEIVDGDSYITAGIDQPITGAFSVYAEYQLEQNVSSSEKDQNNYAIGTKIVF